MNKPFVLRTTSATQISTHALCPRKWFYKYPLGLKEPGSRALDLGNEVHGQNEDYRKGGALPAHPSAALLFTKGHPLLPSVDAPGTHIIELPKDRRLQIKAAGLDIWGRTDYLYLAPDPASQPAWLWDWKTKGSFKYLPTPEDLARDIQLGIYGTWLFENHPAAQEVVFSHGCILVDGDHPEGHPAVPDARVVSTEVLDRAHVRSVFLGLEAEVEKIKVTAACSSVEETEGREAGCTAFGGCPFLAQCSVGQALSARRMTHRDIPTHSTTQTPEEIMRTTQQSLIDQLNAGKAPAPVALSAAPVAINPPDAAVPPPVTPYVPVAAAPTATAAPIPAVESATPAPLPAPPSATLELYVNSLPRKGVVTFSRLEDLIAEHAAPILREEGVTEIGLLPFNRGIGRLRASFIARPPTGVVVARHGGHATQIIEVLSGMAVRVHEGTA